MIEKNIIELIEKLKKNWHNLEILTNIKSWKEAIVYKVLLDWKVVALKIYKEIQQRTFKNNSLYLDWKFYKSPSHKKAMLKWNAFSKKLKHNNWVKREYFLLENLFKLNANIPKPIMIFENCIFMEYIWDENSVAKRLLDINLDKETAKIFFDIILKNILIFWNFWIVHWDLSAYNILYFKENIYIIDFPQSINKKTNPNLKDVLEKDLKNIEKYFSKYFEIDFNKLISLFN